MYFDYGMRLSILNIMLNYLNNPLSVQKSIETYRKPIRTVFGHPVIILNAKLTKLNFICIKPKIEEFKAITLKI